MPLPPLFCNESPKILVRDQKRKTAIPHSTSHESQDVVVPSVRQWTVLLKLFTMLLSMHAELPHTHVPPHQNGGGGRNVICVCPLCEAKVSEPSKGSFSTSPDRTCMRLSDQLAREAEERIFHNNKGVVSCYALDKLSCLFQCSEV